jgi:DNA-binding NtrC family response regulator
MAKPDSGDEFLEHVFPGRSAPMDEFRAEILQLNQYCQRYKGAITCVLITGETGVGKNFTARAISAHSQWLTMTQDERRDLFYDKEHKKTIVFPAEQLVDQLLKKEHRQERGKEPQRVTRLATVLGPQLADDLAGSELFGHMQHAFTDAKDTHVGIFGDEAVDDVLLDEIADLSPKVQAKLMQFIDTHTFRPVGGIAKDEKTSQHRVFLATNRPLETWVQEGQFRHDLYWRMYGQQIKIPPLRERREVIRDLVFSILKSVNHRHRGAEGPQPSVTPEEEPYCLLPNDQWTGGKPQTSNWVTVLTPEDLQWCEEYDWPGNVRELRKRLELYVYRNGHRRLKDVLPAQDLNQFVVASTSAGGTRTADPAVLIETAVNNYLQGVLDGRVTAPGKPNDLVTAFRDMVTASVYRFKVRNRLSGEEVARIFPEAKDAETTIGRWKPSAVET